MYNSGRTVCLLAQKLRGGVLWFGKHSLEVYVTHYPLLTLLLPSQFPQTGEIKGVLLVIVNYLATLVVVYAITRALKNNSALQKLLFMKDG